MDDHDAATCTALVCEPCAFNRGYEAAREDGVVKLREHGFDHPANLIATLQPSQEQDDWKQARGAAEGFLGDQKSEDVVRRGRDGADEGQAEGREENP